MNKVNVGNRALRDRHPWLIVLMLGLGLSLSTTAGWNNASPAGHKARAGRTGAEASVSQPPVLPRPDHTVIVIEENKAHDDVIGSSCAPYIQSLVIQGASMDQFFAFHHPSQPNYMEFFSGENQGVTTDDCPPTTPAFKGPSLGGIVIEKQLRFAGYAEDLPNPMLCMSGNFYQRHAPWVDFQDVPRSDSLDFKTFPKGPAGFAKLPEVSLVIPSVIHDMHNVDKSNQKCNQCAATEIQQQVCDGDWWLHKNLAAYANWAKHNKSLLIITWDEDSSMPPPFNTTPPNNRIPTIFVGAMVRPGIVVSTQYNHYDLLRTIEDMYGLRRIGGSATAKPIQGIWR